MLRLVGLLCRKERRRVGERALAAWEEVGLLGMLTTAAVALAGVGLEVIAWVGDGATDTAEKVGEMERGLEENLGRCEGDEGDINTGALPPAGEGV